MGIPSIKDIKKILKTLQCTRATLLTLDLLGGGGLLVFLRDRLWGPDGVSFDPKMSM